MNRTPMRYMTPMRLWSSVNAQEAIVFVTVR